MTESNIRENDKPDEFQDNLEVESNGFIELSAKESLPSPPTVRLPDNNEEKPSVRYARFWSRLLAYSIDNVILLCIIAATFSALISIYDFSIFDDGTFGYNLFVAFFLYSYFLFVGYFAIFTGGCGQTIGKMILRISVISDMGGEISFPRSFIRSLGYIISGLFFYIGFLISLFDKKSQTLHDKLSGAVVVEID